MIVETKVGQSRIVVDSSRGGAIDELILDGVQVLELQEGFHYEASLLFPFPNRLEGGTFTFEQQKYQFPINDFGLPNALHGFIAELPFKSSIQADKLILTCDYGGDRDYYPFPFGIELTYHLQERGLDIQVAVQNTGRQQMPCAFGWHPYFKVNDPAIKLPEVTRVLVGELMIPNGQKEPFDRFGQMKTLKGVELDSCFELVHKQGGTTLLQMAADQGIEIWQDESFGFIQVFTPGDRRSVAIEPMTGNIDALNNGEGLKVLEPNEVWELSFGLRLT
jgi:aldose 1-epimerase